MRISSLALKAYGHFTDTVLEFGDQPALHVALGDNESGKSTSLRALSSVLFGYPHHAVDAFRHDTLNMAIGAALVARDGRRVAFIRRRRGKQLLTTADGQPLADSAVAALLGNASQDLFERVFALDHPRLQAHAKAMLLEGGSLGFSLAEAGAGVTGIKEILDKISAQTRTLFLPTGTNPRINSQIRHLAELRKDARARTVSPDRYQKLETELADAAAAVQENRAQIAELRTTLNRLERIRRNLPRRSELAMIAEQLQPLGAVPLLAPDAPARRQKAQSDGAAAGRRLADATAKIDEVDGLLAQTPVDTALLARRADIAVLTDRRGAIAKDHTDRPAVERSLTQEREKASDLLRLAELAGDVDTLDTVIPSTIKRQAIASLIEQHKVLATKRASALEQSDAAAIELATAEQALAKLPGSTDTSALDAAIRDADALGDIDTELDRRRRRLAADRKALQDRCIALGLASSDIAALRRLSVPTRSAVRQFADDLTRLDKSIAALDDDATRLRDDITGKTAQADRLRTTGGVLSEEDLLNLRRHRDSGWSLIRRRLLKDLSEDEIGSYVTASGAATPLDDSGLANLYERKVTTADEAADRMRTNASTVAALALLEKDIAAAHDKIAAVGQEWAQRDASRGQLLQSWAAAWETTDIAPGRPSEMMEWNDRRDDILARDDQLVVEEADLAATETKLDRIATALHQAAAGDGSSVVRGHEVAAGAGFTATRDAAKVQQTRLARANQDRRLAEQTVADKTARRNAAQVALSTIDRSLTDWQAAWHRAASDAGLNPALAAEQAATVLEAFNDLQHQAALIRNLAHRVNGMVRDIRIFNADVAKLWKDVSTEPMPDDHLAAARLLEDRLRAADNADKRRTDLVRQRQAENAIAEAAHKDIADSDLALTQLCVDAKCSDVEQLSALEVQSQAKRKLIERRDQLESDMLHDGAGLELATMLEECTGVAGDELPGRIADLRANETRLEEQYRRFLETETNLRTAFDQLMADEQAAVVAQRAVNTETEIAASVEDYACLAAEEALLRAAIDLYRERHQGPVLPRARALFAELTDGAYRGLAVDNDGTGQPVLIAERDDGTRLDVAALSDGTRDALYLALRLAVVQEYNARQEPLPFIADDLLLHLDDTRAKAAFRALAKVAETGQVLFFTHNPHMLALARDAVPAGLLGEHRLTPPARAA